MSEENLQLKNALLESAKKYEPDMVAFLKDIIACYGESCNEEKVVLRIKEEMEKVGFDSAHIDGLGNVVGRIGNGKRIIAMDAHIDTVGKGKLEDWKTDPVVAEVIDDKVYGLGASDQKSGMVGMVYGAKIMKDHNLLGDFTLYVTGTVQEEDCDGMCWRYIIDKENLRPECVVITEPTGLNLNIGHRGRMEIEVVTRGKASHGSMPHLGVNAIYAMSRLVREIEILNENLRSDPFLGKGTIVVSNIKSKAPSMCSVPFECSIYIDRRLTVGENAETAVADIKEAAKRAGIEVEVSIPLYEKPSFKGTVYKTECYFPTWKLDDKHPLLKAAIKTYEQALSEKPVVDKWVFSTNGIATMGVYGIPTIGFGPSYEKLAHAPNEYVPVEHLVKSAQWYALFPKTYTEIMEEKANDSK